MTCERCHARLFLEDGLDGEEYFCLICGNRFPVQPVQPLDKPAHGPVPKYEQPKYAA